MKQLPGPYFDMNSEIVSVGKANVNYPHNCAEFIISVRKNCFEYFPLINCSFHINVQQLLKTHSKNFNRKAVVFDFILLLVKILEIM